MPVCSSFTPCGMFYCSSQPSKAQKIYSSMRAAQGNEDGAFREFGYQGAKLYATAMLFARFAEIYDRIKEQHSPSTMTFFLEEKEREYGIVPDTSKTDEQRRSRIKVRLLSGVGSTQAQLIAGLTEILGNKFVSLKSSRDSAFFGDLIDAFPTTPPSYVNYKDSTTSGKWMKATHNWGAGGGNLIAELFCGDPPEIGDVFVFGSHNESLTQKCTVTQVTSLGNKLYSMNFSGVTKPVEKDQGFTTNSYPIWDTGRRRFLVELDSSILADNNLLNDLDNFMERTIRGVSIWQKAVPPNQTGGFQLNGGSNPGKLGFTLLETP